MRGISVWLFLIACCFVLVSCGGNPSQDKEGIEDEDANRFVDEEIEVTVQIMNKEEDQIGTAVLTEVTNGVKVKLQAANLPEGELAIHFHEKAMCDSPDFETAGGHFNPEEKDHGLDNPDGPHAGDMKNLEVEEDGTVIYEEANEMVTLKENKDNSLKQENGTSIIIHEDADDGKSQPAGNAGARIACGVID